MKLGALILAGDSFFSGDQKWIFFAIIVLMFFYNVTSSFLERQQIHWIHETGLGIIIGFFIGWILEASFNVEESFDGDSFFAIILPCIVFAGGYNMRKRQFFMYFFDISLYAIFGTLVNFFVNLICLYYLNKLQIFTSIAHPDKPIEFQLETILYFAATMCASDEVAALTLIQANQYPQLFSIIFGEGLLNDSVAIILFKAVVQVYGSNSSDNQSIDGQMVWNFFKQFFSVSFFSVIIGIFPAIIGCLITKNMKWISDSPVQESMLILLISYLTYDFSENLEMAGIISMLTCGIIMSHYITYNITYTGKMTTSIFVECISKITEAFLFIYLGISCWPYFTNKGEDISINFILVGFGVIMLGRFMCIFGSSWICILFKQKNFKPNNYQLSMIWYSGVIRGAVSYALIMTVKINNGFPAQEKILQSTVLFIVFITTIIFGAFMPLYIKFNMKLMNRKYPHMAEENKQQLEKEENTSPQQKQKWGTFKKLDQNFFKVWFIKDYKERRKAIQLEQHRVRQFIEAADAGNLIYGQFRYNEKQYKQIQGESNSKRISELNQSLSQIDGQQKLKHEQSQASNDFQTHSIASNAPNY